MEIKRGWLWSARYFFAFHWGELGGWLGSTAVSLYGMLAPDRLQPSSLIAAVPDWAWLLFLLACYVALALVAFHRMKERLLDEIDRQRSLVAVAEASKAAAEKRFADLFRQPETGPGLRFLSQHGEMHKPPSVSWKGAVDLSPRYADHDCYVWLQVTTELAPPRRVLLWCDQPIYHAGGEVKVEGERWMLPTGLGFPSPPQGYTSTSLPLPDKPIPAGATLWFYLNSPNPIRLLKADLVPAP